MTRYIARRLLEIPPTVLFAAVLVFGIARLAPGDPISNALGPTAQADTVRALRAEYGLDRPLPVQLLSWLGGVLQGDLGRSLLTREPVVSMVLSRAQPTAVLTVASAIVFVLASIPLGVLAAARHNTPLDRLATLCATIGVGLPNFFLAVVLIFVFGIYLRWLPLAGFVHPLEDVWGALRHLVLPVVTLTAFYIALTTRLVRLSVLDALREDYVRTARAKGLSEREVLLRHAARNGLIAATTATGINIAYLLGGSVVIEEIFAIPGLGRLLFTAVVNRDFPVIQGVALAASLFFILSSLVADIVLVWLDPRVRLE